MGNQQVYHIHTPEDLPSEDARLAGLYQIHRAFRPQFAPFASEEGYLKHLRAILAEPTTGLMLAIEGEKVLALALYRTHHNTYQNHLFFLEDLVVAEEARNLGIGADLLRRCELLAKEQGCAYLSLDSGVQRLRAHRFYFAHGYHIESFHFVKALSVSAEDGA